jgi:hypothetical protein
MPQQGCMQAGHTHMYKPSKLGQQLLVASIHGSCKQVCLLLLPILTALRQPHPHPRLHPFHCPAAAS